MNCCGWQRNDCYSALTSINTANTSEKNKCIISWKDEEVIVLSSKTSIKHKKTFEEDYIEFVYDNKISFVNYVGTITNKEKILQKNYNDYSYLYVKELRNNTNENQYNKKKGNYISYFHHGNFETISIAYEKIIQYAKNHNFKLDEYFFEDLLVNEITVKSPKEFIFEVSIRIID